MPTAFVLQPHKWSKIFGLENHLSMYTQWPFPFILLHNLSTTLNAVWCSGRMCPSMYVQVVDITAFCLTKFKHFYPIFVGLSFDINMKEYTPLKWVYCLVDGQLFFWCVDVLKFCDECVNNWPNFEKWVIAWLSPSCLCVVFIEMEHCQYRKEPIPETFQQKMNMGCE